jgi:chromosome segregation protein
MQLLSLSISGFKSFAKPEKLEFAPGITAVVGPNGCGKSNIVDALRWVLGEQRSAVLRSDHMENVIFNGTALRKPGSMAEVKIALDNSQGVLNVPYTEVEIARRLYRDGTSEYLLNGHDSRLKDINDLLHDSGMGPNLYTILELKMVEEILREDGEGRRMLFEEAAGVAKYKIKRRQALQKLRQTEEDLVRLADILSEVERQVSSLKRQSMRAKRYEEFTAQLHRLEAALIYREYLRLKSELEPLEIAMQDSTASSESVKSSIRLEEAKLTELRAAELDLDREVGDFGRQLATVVAGISTMEAEEAGLRAKDQAAKQTIERARRERSLLEEKRGLLDERLATVQTGLVGCREELELTEQRVATAAEKLAGAENRLSEIQTQMRDHAKLLAQIRGRLASAQRDAGQIALAEAGHASRKEMLQNELVSMARERDTVSQKLIEFGDVMKSFDQEEQAVRERERRLTTELQTTVNELTQLEERSRELAGLIESTQAKLDLLATLEEKGPRSHSALRALKSSQVEGLIELLGDTIDVDDRYRRALQAALGPAAYYYLTESVESALTAMEMLRRERAGQTTFLPLAEFHTEPTDRVRPPEGTLGTALGVLNGTNPNPIIEHFLGRVVIVNDWQDAIEFYPWARDNACTLVTLDGQWIGGRGLLSGGSEDTGIPVDLGLAKQMSELRQRLEESRGGRDDTQVRIRGIRSNMARVEQEISDVRRELDSLSSRRSDVRDQQLKLETRLAGLSDRTGSAEQQIVSLDEKIEECRRQYAESQLAVQAVESELKAAESSGGDLSWKVAEAQKESAKEREGKHECERERDAVKHKLDLLNLDGQRIQQSLTELAEELEASERAAAQASSDLQGLEARLAEIETTSLEKYRARDELAGRVDKSRSRLDEMRNRAGEQDERLRNLREAHAGELEGSRKIELEVARLRGELDALVGSALTQNGLDLAASDFVEQHPSLAETEATAELLQECKQKIERLGPINSLAVEEYARENERLTVMLTQRDDLLKAKQTLEETIARINETAQARFLHTFEAVRQHFQRLFQEFFVAGEADLIMSGPDMLDADITLWANPSGKRLKSLTLMSGGEKTMTAIALLFALYHVKPSPFCVFDEVDAPLDDANIDRFNRVIRMHAENTQFILITHNRRTMEIADNLYGVTMEEEGISKLVSVRLLSSVA